jgi:hypothetical protein
MEDLNLVSSMDTSMVMEQRSSESRAKGIHGVQLAMVLARLAAAAA